MSGFAGLSNQARDRRRRCAFCHWITPSPPPTGVALFGSPPYPDRLYLQAELTVTYQGKLAWPPENFQTRSGDAQGRRTRPLRSNPEQWRRHFQALLPHRHHADRADRRRVGGNSHMPAMAVCRGPDFRQRAGRKPEPAARPIWTSKRNMSPASGCAARSAGPRPLRAVVA